MAESLPPPPLRNDLGDFSWLDWYNKLYKYLKTSGSIAWSAIDFSGSNISDIQTRNHNSLQGFQGGTAGEYYHLTAAEYATITSNDPKYGAFHNTSSMTAASANTAYTMTLDSTDYYNGVTLVSGSQLTAAYAGVYNVQFSAQLTNTDTNIHEVSIWLRQNGSDVAMTNSIVAVPNSHGGSDGHTIAAWNFFIQLSAGDYVELCWSTESTTVFIEATSALSTPTRPATPSLIVTMDRVHA